MENLVDVMVAYRKDKKLKPCRFRWGKKMHGVKAVTTAWASRIGMDRVHHYTIAASDGNDYELSFNTTQDEWTLHKIINDDKENASQFDWLLVR